MGAVGKQGDADELVAGAGAAPVVAAARKTTQG